MDSNPSPKFESIIFSGLLDELEKRAQDALRWKTPLITADGRKWTKLDIFQWYREPVVRRNLLRDLGNRPATVIQTLQKGIHVLKRKEKGQYIRILKDDGNPEDVRDLSYFIERRATEFHPTMGATTDRLVVDIDPAPGFGFNKAKELASSVIGALRDTPSVKSTELRFSGGDGFYAIGHLSKHMKTDTARELLKDRMKPLEGERVTMGVATKDQARLDLSPMKRMGSHRGLYSFNARTGLVSVPVRDIESFKTEDADPLRILGRKPKPTKPARP